MITIISQYRALTRVVGALARAYAFLSPPVPSDAPVFGATVHIVDDDASFRTALERRLRRAGYDVAVYPTAQQLLNDLCESGLGCIILDVRMPGLRADRNYIRGWVNAVRRSRSCLLAASPTFLKSGAR